GPRREDVSGLSTAHFEQRIEFRSPAELDRVGALNRPALSHNPSEAVPHVPVPHSFRCSKTISGRVDSLQQQDPDLPLSVASNQHGLIASAPTGPTCASKLVSSFRRFLSVIEAAAAVG